MTPHNHLAASGFAATLVQPDRSRDLDAYDRLPAVVRQALEDAPLAICAIAALHHLRAHGLVSVLREIRESCDDFYAEAERQTGMPRPTTPLVADKGRRTCRR